MKLHSVLGFRFARLWDARTIGAAALLCTVVSLLSVQFLGRYLSSGFRPNLEVTSNLIELVFFALLVLDVCIVVGSVSAAFRRNDQRALLFTVVTSYFSLMLLFASIYYQAAFFGDLKDAVFKYSHYRDDAVAKIDGPIYDDRRAFHGIDRRLWSGVDWPVRAGSFPSGLPPGTYKVTAQQMRNIAATRTAYEVIQFIPDASVAVFADCVHLSIITMTTVGYGDITPRSLGARFAADCEAVCNTLLLIFGLGMVFGNLRFSRGD